jgi:hypothetical protein
MIAIVAAVLALTVTVESVVLLLIALDRHTVRGNTKEG